MHIFIFALIMMLAPISIEAKDVPKTARPYGGTLVWGTYTKPTIINPILTTHSVSMSLLDLIFNRLVRLNTKGEIEPDLAQSWDISADGLVYTFYLRKGVKFHDGVECTAFDVKFSYDRIIDPQNNSPLASLFELVRDFKAIDKYTFRITLRQPSAPFIYRLVREIVPKHILEGADLKTCSFNWHPVGSGPFRFKEWDKDDRIILEYNPDYYEGRPYLDEIIVKSYPDSQSLWIAFMRGEADFVGFIEREDYEILKDDPAFKAYAFYFDNYYALFYNTNDPILRDKIVREAIAYGIDRKSLIERVAGGYGLECNGPFYPGSLGFNHLVKPFEYNPQKAQVLLAQVGWQDMDNDGILEKDGEELEIKVLVDARKDILKRIIMVLRQQLQEIGIKIKVILYEDEGMLINEDFLKQNKPQAHLKFPLADPDRTEEEWRSNFVMTAKVWQCNIEEIDRLFALGKVTQDNQERKKIYQNIHKIICENQLACFLYFPFCFFAVSQKFENTEAFFTINMPIYTMKDWYLDSQMGTDKRHR